jgi:two-component system, NtrC family, response regulator HydG
MPSGDIAPSELPSASAAKVPLALVVDDDAGFRAGVAELVKREGFAVASVGSLKEARAELLANPPDILLVDLHLPDGSGLSLLEAFEANSAPEVVLITGSASIETAVEALRLGVADYLTKPLDFARVKMALGNVTRALELRGEIGTLRGELRKLGRFGRLIGGSAPMQKVYDLIGRVAGTSASILVSGETGTGKELVAETIHKLSRRSRLAFLPVNCGALSAHLIETELFGHERGSFTGADRMHKGYFERANGGTLFLDEVTEAVDIQVRLLRALETSTITRVGGTEKIKVDVRVVAATSREVEEAIASGKLREDLYYRLNVFPIHLPPLRERGDDVELLAEHFLGELNQAEGARKRFTRACLDRLHAHAWPGNVRELHNVVRRAFILADEELGVETLPAGSPEAPATLSVTTRLGSSIAEAERRIILATLEHCKGDKKRAADVLKVSLKTLYSRLNEYKAN